MSGLSATYGPDGGIAKTVFDLVPGVWWPSADDDGLRSLATAWRATADEVESAGRAAGSVIRSVTTENTGREFDALGRFWRSLDSGGGAGHLPNVSATCRDVATSCDQLAAEVATARHRVIVELTVAASVIIASVGLFVIPVVGELAAAGAAVASAALVSATAGIGIALGAVAADLAATVLVGAALGALAAVTVDVVVAQPVRMAFGDQKWGHWSTHEMLAAAEGGTVGGGVGGGLAGAAALSGRLSTSIPGLLQTRIGQTLAGSGVNAATGWVLHGHISGLDLLTGAVGGYAGHAVAGSGARVRLSYQNRARLARFRALLADETGAIGPGAGELKATTAGLRSPVSMRAMAREVKDLEPAWAGMSPGQRMHALRTLIDARLTTVGAPKSQKVVLNDSGAAGFNPLKWEFQLDARILPVDTEFRWLMETAYHEARHAEQFFRMARLKAGEGMSVAAMTKSIDEGGMGLPQEVAELAAARPLARDSAEGREAAVWYDSLYSEAGKAHRDLVHKEMFAASEKVSFWQMLHELARRDPEHEENLHIFEDSIDTYLKLYAEKEAGYLALPEEVDAHAVHADFAEYLDETGVAGPEG